MKKQVSKKPKHTLKKLTDAELLIADKARRYGMSIHQMNGLLKRKGNKTGKRFRHGIPGAFGGGGAIKKNG